MLVALADARRRYPIPPTRCTPSIDGGAAGHGAGALRDFDELRGYCRRVAGAVGVACVAVYGGASAAAKRGAEALAASRSS